MSVVGIVRYFVAALIAISAACSSAEAAKRIALVIGNSAYQYTPALANPVNDAEDLAKTLSGLGFQVTKSINLGKADMQRVLTNFAVALRGAEIGLFFYAGHGMQVSGRNHLVPIDAKLDAASTLEFETVRLDTVQALMEQETSTNVLFLDACRDNPLARNLARAMGTRSNAVGRGLAPQEAGAGTMISYSTQPGAIALDGTGGRNSPFAGALVRHLPTEGKDLSSILLRVRKDVMAATANRQVPWDHSALTNELILAPRIADAPAITTMADRAKPPGGSSVASQVDTVTTKAIVAAKPDTKSATTSDLIFADSFDGNTLGKHWTISNEEPDAYLVENGALYLLSSQPGAARNMLRLNGVELEGDWDISVHFRRQFLSGYDMFQIGLADGNTTTVRATLWYEPAKQILSCSSLSLGVSAAGSQKVEHNTAVRRTGNCGLGAKTETKEEFDSAIDGLAKAGGTLTLTKRDRNYHATFTSPVLVNQVATSRVTVLRASGHPAFFVGRFGDASSRQTSALVEEFRVTRGK